MIIAELLVKLELKIFFYIPSYTFCPAWLERQVFDFVLCDKHLTHIYCCILLNKTHEKNRLL